ncbi:uncharacterized protein LOC119632553 [Glossina fuscipes]|uniref:Uncharacterized protein LOC119632553 n=1 Tax=Glossina fuscipes TaxID=7396 RepID=A0A8U0W816_9MUSC|nr:uncharacterized protein LOC119632553 [Glossina fuscipes]
MVHSRANEIWIYFDNNKEEGVATCKTCQQRLRNNRSYNLRQHLRKLHNIDLEPRPEELPHCSPQPYDESQIKDLLKVAKRRMLEDQEMAAKRARRCLPIELEKSTMINAVMGLVVHDGLPLKIFDSKYMKALLNPICESISDLGGKEFHITKIRCHHAVDLVADYIRKCFASDLTWRLLSLKFESFLESKPGIRRVFAQYVHKGQVAAHILGIIDFNINSSEKIEKKLKELLDKFHIDMKQVIAACDYSRPSWHGSEMSNAEYMDYIDKFEEYNEIAIKDIKISRPLGHIAQLCAFDVIKNEDVYSYILECRNLARFLSNPSNGYYELLESKELRIPKVDSPCVWGSTYVMMEALKATAVVLRNIKFEPLEQEEDKFNLNEDLWSFIESYCIAMGSLQKAIIKFSQEEVHYGDFYAQWLKTKLMTEKLHEIHRNKKKFCLKLITLLLQSFEDRSKEILRHKHLYACLFLDPRFQHTLTLQEKLEAISYLKQLWNRAKVFQSNAIEEKRIPIGSDNANNRVGQPTELLDDEDAFLNEFLSQDIPIRDRTVDDVHVKIEKFKLPFQLVDTNVLQFWQEQNFSEPELYILSSVCFAMPITPIPQKIKTLCSLLKSLTNDNSGDPSGRTLENLTFIRLNMHLLSKTIAALPLFEQRPLIIENFNKHRKLDTKNCHL